jgi:Domain of unknown function (DUF4142)
MNWESATSRITRRGFACAFLWLASGIALANAQTAAPTEVPATLNPVDFNFVGQANLGAPFQVDSGRLAETKGTSAAIRSYAHLMVTSHIPVVDALNAILQRKNVTPSNTPFHAQGGPRRRIRPGLRERSGRVPKGKCGAVPTGDPEWCRPGPQAVRAPNTAEDRRSSAANHEARRCIQRRRRFELKMP